MTLQQVKIAMLKPALDNARCYIDTVNSIGINSSISMHIKRIQSGMLDEV